MSLAIGRLLDPGSGNLLGTVFAVSREYALTAFHCVGERDSAVVSHPKVVCEWKAGTNEALVEDWDPTNDIALLKLKRKLPRELKPIDLATQVPSRSPFTAPGAPVAAKNIFNFAISGEITWAEARLPDGSTAMQLTCNESLAGLPLQGLSGAPVLVGNARTAAGVIRWNLPRDHEPELAAGASVFATPSRVLIERWGPILNVHTGEGEDIGRLGELAARGKRRDIATVVVQLKSLLISGDLNLSEPDFEQLESPSPDSQLIEIRPGLAIVALRSDLRVDRARQDGERTLGRHVARRSSATGQRYIGILTDGAEWHLYHQGVQVLRRVDQASLFIDRNGLDTQRFSTWIESVLATATRLRPTPREIERRLGANSPSYHLNKAELTALFKRNQLSAYVRIRRDMWAKLLTTASGTSFDDDEDLFIDHTLLALMAQVVGHAVIGFNPDDSELSAADLVAGSEFAKAQIAGVVEPDFFDWVAHVAGGDRYIKGLVRQLTRFSWSQVEHDVMKVLYQSIIPQKVRHALGEYYTPDWLAEGMILECVKDPLNETALDASCGSGTFLFHAVRRYMSHAEAAGFSTAQMVRGVTERVRGFDVHPVAVTLARVTYLLAIGMHVLRDATRPAFAVPVHLCDSLRWGQHETLWSYNGLSVPTQPEHGDLLYDPEFSHDEDFTERLKFPDSVMEDSDSFDRLVTALADDAVKDATEYSESLQRIFRRFTIPREDQAILKQTFKNMRDLHRQGRDHIWGYYVRNLARPVWTSRPDNRIDVLIGNPPWLAYRNMTSVQRRSYREMSVERGLWAGPAHATSQDLASLFVARCIELYLKPGGRFGYVMPRGTLRHGQYEGFRRGLFPSPSEDVGVRFGRPWDLHMVKPAFFSQSVAVIFGRRAAKSVPAKSLVEIPEVWSGTFATKSATWADASVVVSRRVDENVPVRRSSPYLHRFVEGATVVPQKMFLVERIADRTKRSHTPDMVDIRSRFSPNEHAPWKELEPLQGSVERQFIHRLYLGRSVAPFRCLEPVEAVIPWDGHELLDPDDLIMHPGLADWWSRAEVLWNRHRKNERMSLYARLNYHRGLSQQFPAPRYRVVSPKSAMYGAAAIVEDRTAFIDQQLYWSSIPTLSEARYLTAILNSMTIQLAVRPLQPRGEHNPRDLCRYAFQLPVPLFDSEDESHQRLVELAEQAEVVALHTPLPDVRFEMQRRHIRKALERNGVAADVDALVKTLID